jgi:hypothetical protein
MIDNNTVYQGTEKIDLYDLQKLRKLIDRLIHLEQTEDDYSLKIDDARTNLKRCIKGLAIDLNIHQEFLESYDRIK